MHIEHITNLQAVLFVGGVATLAYVVFRVIPGVNVERPRTSYRSEEITAYDRALPKYFVAAVAAVAIGAIHAVIKDIPPLYEWLALAGHGGHLIRDIANTHLVIVLGGTVAATGLTWYVLPRMTGRPLYSERLASLSFWCTLIGAGGFYLANVALGIVLGRMARQGIPYDVAKSQLGVWRAVPIGVSASVMGIGYWTFVADVVITAWVSRRVETPRPHAHLIKYFVIGALGLFAGTVQGVIQVMPSQEAWIRAAVPAGHYIDPIAHAHVNLVTGMLSLIAGLAFFWLRDEDAERGRRREQLVFWTLVPGSLMFYATFLFLGFSEGRLIVDHGLSFEQAMARMGPLHVVPLMVSGIVTLTGVWLLLGTILIRVLFGHARRAAGSAFVLLGIAALFVGTAQGLIQLLPPVKLWLEAAGQPGDAIANAHAQLNILGGVLSLLVGLLFLGGVGFAGRVPRPEVTRRIAGFAAVGAGTYYLSAMATAVVLGRSVASGRPLGRSLGLALPWGPLGMALGAALYAVAFVRLSGFGWSATTAYRKAGWAEFLRRLAADEGSSPRWRQRIPVVYYLAAELLSGSVGFPGLGWILSGRSTVGLPMALGGPFLAWAMIPLVTSPRGAGTLSHHTIVADALYLSISTLTSLLVLWWIEAREQRIRRLEARLTG
ncbi:MAG TPA: cbb3-type cytochrome c oxidase subunit I [Actinomycetota bacterium]|nr:cbb3-type cytochrome c oxidase subunit I [Actinomycetota bacterium]